MWHPTKAYKASFPFQHAHINTVAPTLIRHPTLPPYQRHNVWLADGDRLLVDHLKLGRKRCVILSHGLEGHSHRHYMTGMANYFSQAGYDVIAWNFRGCGGEANYRPRFYHSGATEDLDAVVSFALQQGYEELSLVGFSMGGNLTLKYVGERTPHQSITSAVAISVPLDLASCARQLAAPQNRIYMKRFLGDLKDKLVLLQRRHPGLVDLSGYKRIKSFVEFDDRYTAPLHGFDDAQDYYQQCSSLNFLASIELPTLIINAKDDPFLTPACFPEQEVANNPYLSMLTPEHGGHMGFMQHRHRQSFWHEQQALAFALFHCQICEPLQVA